MGLTRKRRVFIAEYLQCWNATEAAIRAGYSKKTARAQGSHLLTKVNIAAEIELAIAEKQMSAKEVLARLAEQARNEQSKYFTDEADVNLTNLIDDGKAHLIKGFKHTRTGIDVEFYDTQAALIQIGKHLKLFTDLTELTGEVIVKVIKGVSMDEL